MEQKFERKEKLERVLEPDGPPFRGCTFGDIANVVVAVSLNFMQFLRILHRCQRNLFKPQRFVDADME